MTKTNETARLTGVPVAAMAPGVVGVLAQDTGRYSMFAASLTGVEVPPGTAIKWEFGTSIASQMNGLVRAMLSKPDAEWLWILGDDHVFAPSLLGKLLGRDVDIVAPLCLTRNPPYKPVLFAGWADPAAGGVSSFLRRRVDLNDHPDGGLIPVHSAGTAGMVVRREVFEALDDPWFEQGRISSTEIGEDVYFCDKARAAGFALHGDLDAPLGHLTVATVWPVKQPEGWTYGFGFQGGLKVTMPTTAWDDADNAEGGTR